MEEAGKPELLDDDDAFDRKRDAMKREQEIIVVADQANAEQGPAEEAAVFRALNIETHSISGKISEDSFNPMVNVQYDATDDLMVYASYAKGTKAGGFDKALLPCLRSIAPPQGSTRRRASTTS